MDTWIFKLLQLATFIYPALFSFFIYTIATLFQNRKGMKMVRIVSLTAAIIFFLVFLPYMLEYMGMI